MRPEIVSPDTRDARLAALKGTLRARAGSFVATVALLQGTAEIVDPLTGRTSPAEGGMRLARGMKLAVRTGRAMVRLDDGSDLWLAAGASIDLSAWGEVGRTVKLLAGRALALVAKAAGAPFRAIAPGGEILVTGTAFEASATADGLAVAVLHGSIEVRTPLGRARATRGREVTASKHAAPAVERFDASGGRFGWAGDLQASASNPAIAPAFRAAAHTLGRLDASPSEESIMATGTRIAVGLVAAALLAGGVYYATRATASPVGPTFIAAKPGALEAKHDGKAPEMKSRRVIKLRGDDGKEITLDGSDPKAIEAALAGVPPEKREKVRAILEGKSLPGNSNWQGTVDEKETVGGPSPDVQAKIQGEVQGGVGAMNDMVKAGMDPKEASDRVSKGVAEGIKQQLNDPDAEVFTQISGENGDNTVMIGIMKKDPADKDAKKPEAKK